MDRFKSIIGNKLNSIVTYIKTKDTNLVPTSSTDLWVCMVGLLFHTVVQGRELSHNKMARVYKYTDKVYLFIDNFYT